jgi:putative flippase GtrA
MDIIKLSLRGKVALANYFIYSVIVALFDTGIVWILVRFTEVHLIAANTIGVLAGFLFHYLLASKSVFNTEYGTGGFIIYLFTFIFGLLLANWLIYMSYHYIFYAYTVNLRILQSKGVSVAVPFFAMYYIRKYLFMKLKRKGW